MKTRVLPNLLITACRLAGTNGIIKKENMKKINPRCFPCRLLVYRHCKCAGYSSKDQFVVLVKYDAQFEF